MASGDSLVIENATADTTLYLTNDLGSAESPFKVHSVTARGMGTVHISGNPIEPSCASWETNIVAECSLVTDFDIKFPAHASLTRVYMWANTNATWRCNGAISGTGQTALRFATSYSGRFDIYGDVSFLRNSDVDFYTIQTFFWDEQTYNYSGWERTDFVSLAGRNLPTKHHITIPNGSKPIKADLTLSNLRIDSEWEKRTKGTADSASDSASASDNNGGEAHE